MPHLIDEYAIHCAHCDGATIVREYAMPDGRRTETTECSQCRAQYEFEIDLTPPPVVKAHNPEGLFS